MASVEYLQHALRVLAVQRQTLREHEAGREALESNRLEVRAVIGSCRTR
jgi:hypothetical protein